MQNKLVRLLEIETVIQQLEKEREKITAPVHIKDKPCRVIAVGKLGNSARRSPIRQPVKVIVVEEVQ